MGILWLIKRDIGLYLHIYTLYFDSLSKKSILTNYQSYKSIKPNSDKTL